MSNIIKGTNTIAFHPGYFLEELLEDNTIRDSIYRYIDKSTIDGIVKGDIDVDSEIADKLSKSIGISSQYWLNLQDQFYVNKNIIIDNKEVFCRGGDIMGDKYTKFGYFLNAYRLKRGISLRDIAYKCEFSTSYLSSMCVGSRNLDMHVVDKIARVLELSNEDKVNYYLSAILSLTKVKVDLTEFKEDNRRAIAKLVMALPYLNDDEFKIIEGIVDSKYSEAVEDR